MVCGVWRCVAVCGGVWRVWRVWCCVVLCGVVWSGRGEEEKREGRGEEGGREGGIFAYETETWHGEQTTLACAGQT